MGKLIDMIEPSFSPGPEIVLTDRCKNARSKWWRLWNTYDRTTTFVVKSMFLQNKSIEEVRAYVKKRIQDFNKNHPYPVDEYYFRRYTDYVPF